MQAAGLAFALALPILIGVALLAACVRDAVRCHMAVARQPRAFVDRP
mgnify:CR=1 FL=1